jgi:hypothetical protein
MNECCSTQSCATSNEAAPACPTCGATGTRVDRCTLEALLTPQALRDGIPPAPRFCFSPTCPVVYFDNAAGVVIDESQLTVAVQPKHPADDDMPICYCFGHTTQSIRDRQKLGGIRSVSNEITQEIRAGNCACELKNPSGRCCLGDVVRIERALPDDATGKP